MKRTTVQSASGQGRKTRRGRQPPWKIRQKTVPIAVFPIRLTRSFAPAVGVRPALKTGPASRSRNRVRLKTPLPLRLPPRLTVSMRLFTRRATRMAAFPRMRRLTAFQRRSWWLLPAPIPLTICLGLKKWPSKAALAVGIGRRFCSRPIGCFFAKTIYPACLC